MIALLALALAGPLDDAATAYDEADWETAIFLLESVEQPSSVVLYDLGHAWYRSGDIPRAIAHYRAASQGRPRNGDLAHSLAIARGDLEDHPPPVDPPRVWQAFLTSGELGFLGALVLGTGSGLAVWMRRKKRAIWGALPLTGLGLVLVLVALLGARAAQEYPVAVVVDSPAVARDAAMADASERFRLSPGTEVRLERSLGGFYRIETGDGRRGWVPTGAVLAVGLPGPPTEAPD